MIDGEQDVLTNSAEVDEAEEAAEAERLFAEIAAEREEPDKDPADLDEAATQKGEGQGDTAGAGQGEEPGQTGGSGDEAAAAAAESGEGDIWANADPKLRAAFEEEAARRARAEQQFRSREGREAAYQRRLAELEAQVGQGAEPQPPLKALLDDPKLKEIVEEYPDLQPLIDKFGAIAERVDGVEGRVSEVSTAASDAVYAAEEKRLAERVPEWVELAQHDGFQAWVDDQPAKVRAVVRDNWNAITNAAAAAEVFEAFRETVNPTTGKEQTNQGGKPGKRDRQAQAAKVAAVSSPSSASGDSDDPAVIFNQFAAKKDRERGVR